MAAGHDSSKMLKTQSGVGVQQIGYGVGTAWFKSAGGTNDAALRAGVVAALTSGFRHLDEAEMYENEQSTGAAVAEWLASAEGKAGSTRNDLFITSKTLTVDDAGGVEAVCKRSLAAMQTSYFDLYLIHAPFQRSGAPFKMPLMEVWRQMEALVEKGLVKAIGVSNWRICDLKQIVGSAKIQPSCNQIEAHPYLQQQHLLNWCADNGIAVAAYAPLVRFSTVAGGYTGGVGVGGVRVKEEEASQSDGCITSAFAANAPHTP
jgi:diketogulonate reductase-like aldo/keto reductase